PLVLPAREPVEPVAHGAVAAHEIGAFYALQLTDGADAVIRERGSESLAYTPDYGDWPLCQEGERFLPTDDREASRLVEVRGDLCKKFAIGKADRSGDADFLFELRRESGQHHGGWGSVQSLGPGKVEKRLIDGKRLHHRRESQHHLPYMPSDARVFFHVWLDDHGFGASLQCLEHGHCRAHAPDAGDVTGGRDHAAFPPSHDHR